jgi:hypothetical protein
LDPDEVLLNLLVSHGQQQDHDEKRVEEQQQEHEALLAVYAQLFSQFRKPDSKLRNESSKHGFYCPCALPLECE